MVFVIHFGEQLFGTWEDVLQRKEAFGRAEAAGDLGEIVEFDFQCQRVSSEVVPFQPFRKFRRHVVKLDDERGPCRKVAFQRMLASDGFADTRCFHGALVDASCKIVIELSGLAEIVDEHIERA